MADCPAVPPQAPSAATAPLLVLWDIDHTLIETRGVGRGIYERAFPVATGKPLRELATVSGRTELDIMRESLRRNGIEPTDEAIHRLARALIQGHEAARNELADRGRALPGAAATLAALAADDLVHQSVLTGNLREVARIKLEVFGLDVYLDLEAGAYGEDNPERAQLVRYAQGRAAKRFNILFDDAHTVLIGDTPNDVRAALQAGVHVIGVATGSSDREELRRAGATVVLTELEPDLARKSINLLLKNSTRPAAEPPGADVDRHGRS